MKFLNLAVPCMLLLLTCASFGQEVSSGSCDPRILPKSISGELQTKFADWRIKAVGDLEAYDRQLWTKSKPNTCPGITQGHFMSPTEQTFAVLLIPRNPGQKGYKVVVFAQSDHEPGFKPIVIEEEMNPGGADPAIYRLPPGLYTDRDEVRKVQIRLDGIQVEKMEVSTTIYFWRNHRFEHLTTSD